MPGEQCPHLGGSKSRSFSAASTAISCSAASTSPATARRALARSSTLVSASVRRIHIGEVASSGRSRPLGAFRCCSRLHHCPEPLAESTNLWPADALTAVYRCMLRLAIVWSEARWSSVCSKVYPRFSSSSARLRARVATSRRLTALFSSASAAASSTSSWLFGAPKRKGPLYSFSFRESTVGDRRQSLS